MDEREPSRPLTSSGFPSQGPRRGLSRLRGLGPACVVLLLGLVLTAGAVLTLRGRESARQRLDVARRTADLAGRIRSRLDFPVDAAASLGSFLRAVDNVDGARFQLFASGVRARQPALYALEYAPVVVAAERAGFEALCGCTIKEPSLGGPLVTAASRDRYLPILYSEPTNPAIGFDLSSESFRRAVTNRLRDEGTTVASERLRLVEDPPGVYSVVVYQPVWRNGERPHDLEARRAAFRGAAIAIFRLRPVLETALDGADTGGLDIVVRDAHPTPAPEGRRGDDPGLLHESRASAGATVLEHPARAVVPFGFADRTWELAVAPAPDALGGFGASTAALIAGLLVSLAAATTVGALGAAARARRRAATASHLGQYKLTEPIGAGGVGVVYRAQHALLRRPTAVKLILPERLDQGRLARFEREVQLTSQLTHPNTIAIYDYGHTPDGIFFYAMEMVDGITFEELIHHDGAQATARTVHLMRQLAGALSEAHAAGLIHRDLKPANAMLARRGGMRDFVKVLDFGLAKEIDVAHGVESSQRISSGTPTTRVGMTRDGGFFGTPGFAAPEAIVGESVDARSDIYSLGAVWYSLLTGGPAYTGESAIAVCGQQVSGPPPPPSARVPAIAPEVDALVLRCMSRDPASRPSSAATLLQLLEELPVPEWTSRMAETWWRGPGTEISAAVMAARRDALSQVPPLRRRVVDVDR